MQACAPHWQGTGRPFAVRVADAENGWPVPMVVFRTNHGQVFATDNNGMAAIDSPELMNREVWFEIEGFGYGVPADGFGFRGAVLHPKPGGRAEIRVAPSQAAKRLGRLTGAGLFAESEKLGIERRRRESGVLGCDSIQAAPRGDGWFLAWGDTALAGRPLGIFHATGASLQKTLPDRPPVRPEFVYFTDSSGAPRPIAEMPGEGPTWLTGMAALADGNGTRRLVASYQKARGLVEVHQTGLCAWNEKNLRFENVRRLWKKSPSQTNPPPYPEGHAAFARDASPHGLLFFGNPFPRLKMPATFEAWNDPPQWTALRPQAEVPCRNGGRVKPHSGSIAWSQFLGKWVAVFTQDKGGPSPLGEVWMATAPEPVGPWRDAVKIADHGNMTFYNPRIHAGPGGIEGRTLLFEGTVSTFFTKNARPIPRHDYNQILYRLDLRGRG